MPNEIFQRSGHRRISSFDFITRSRKYLTAIISNQQEIRDLAILFSDGQEIWPDQCEYSVSLLERAQEPVKAFCTLVDTSAILPVSVTPLRYPLLVTLHHLDEQIDATSALISELRSICRTSSRRPSRKHNEIRRNLASLLTCSEDLLRLTQDIIDQAQFEERILAQAAYAEDEQEREGRAAELRQTDELQAADNITCFTLARRRRSQTGESGYFSQTDRARDSF